MTEQGCNSDRIHAAKQRSGRKAMPKLIKRELYTGFSANVLESAVRGVRRSGVSVGVSEEWAWRVLQHPALGDLKRLRCQIDHTRDLSALRFAGRKNPAAASKIHVPCLHSKRFLWPAARLPANREQVFEL